jgi:hydrogenase nickel incorporation protein HypA/HybF
VAEHADLAIDHSDVVVHCSQCNCESKALPNRLICGECGDFRTRIVSGDEMILQSVELSPVDRRLADTA